MDVHCCGCGEPWDNYHLRHELKGQSDKELAEDGWRFGSSRLAVLACPCCRDNDKLPDAKERETLTQTAAELMGDDEDGLASLLGDFGL